MRTHRRPNPGPPARRLLDRQRRRMLFEPLEGRSLLAVWDGGGGDANWSTPENWAGDVPLVAGDSLVFPAGALQLTSNNDLGLALSQVTFSGDGYVLEGNPLTLSSGIAQNLGVNGINSIAFEVTLNGAQSVSNNGDGELHLNGSLTIIGDLEFAGPGAVVINQAFTGSNLTVSGGNLELGDVNAAVNSLTMTGGSIATGLGTLTVSGPITTNAFATAAAISGNLSLDGSTRQFSVADGAAADDLTISAVISNGGVTKIEAGTLKFSGTNTYAGLTTVSSGVLAAASAGAFGTAAAGTTITGGAAVELSGDVTIAGETITPSGHGVGGNGALRSRSGTNEWSGLVQLGADGSVGVDAGSVLTVSGVISGQAFAKWGSGRVNLTAANTYTGLSELIGGVTRISHASALGTTAGATTVHGGSSLELSGDITTAAEALTIHNSTLALTNVTGENTWSGTVLVGSASRVNVPSGKLTITGTVNNNGNLLTSDVASNAVGALTFAGAISGGGGFTKIGAGTGGVTFQAANTYSGVTTISNGPLRLTGSGTLGDLTSNTIIAATGSLIPAANLTIAENLRLTGVGFASDGTIHAEANVEFTGAITLDDHATIHAGSYELKISGGIGDVALNRNLTVKSAAGVGVVAFSGANSFLGRTKVDTGTLRVDAVTALTSMRNVELLNGGVLQVNTGNLSINEISGQGNIDLGGFGLTFGLFGSAASVTGNLVGSGDLTKVGAGLQSFNGSHTFQGLTRVEGGELRIQGDMADSPLAVDIEVEAGAFFYGPLTTEADFRIPAGGTLGGSEVEAGDVFLEPASVLRIDYTAGMSVSGSLTLSEAILDVQVNAPAVTGQRYVIVDLLGVDAAVGDFAGMPEGSVIEVGGDVFQITYEGGDGNDIELWALDLSTITVSWTSSGQTVNEAAGVIALSAQLSAASNVDVSFPVVITGASMEGSDFHQLQGSLRFAAGAMTGVLEINIVDDSRFESAETMILTISPTSGILLGAIDAASILITDNDTVPTISFAPPTVQAREGTSAFFEIVLSGETDLPVTVPLVVSGSAILNSDYALPGGSTVVIPPGARSARVALNIIDDSNTEAAEFGTIRFGTLVNAAPATGDAAVDRHQFVIPANDAPLVSFRTGGQTIEEPSSTLAMAVTAQLSGAAIGSVNVPFTVHGTAGSGDRTVFGSSITIPQGQTSGVINLQLFHDVIDESTETVILRLGQPSGATLNGISSHTIEIRDNDTTTVQFVTDRQSVWEDEGSTTVQVRLSNPSSEVVLVPISVSGTGKLTSGQAKRDADFSVSTEVFEFLPGESLTQTRTITILNDPGVPANQRNEKTENLVLTLGVPNHAVPGKIDRHVVTIKDDDPLVNLAPLDITVNEFTTQSLLIGSFPFVATLSAPTNKEVRVPVKIGGSATSGADHQLAFNPAVGFVFPVGFVEASLPVLFFDDGVDEGQEDVSILLKSPTGGALLGTRTADQIEIVDNEPTPYVYFDFKSTTIPEYYGGGIPVTVRLSKPSSRDVVVDLDFVGTADFGKDYRLESITSDGKITIKKGTTWQSFGVFIKNDNDHFTGTHEVLEMKIKSVTNANKPKTDKFGSQLVRTITIGEDDVKPASPPAKPNPKQASIDKKSGGDALPFTIALETGVTVEPDEVFDFYIASEPVAKVDVSEKRDEGPPIPGTISISTGQGGPLLGATAFFDANFNGAIDFLDFDGNGVQDAGEPSEPATVAELNGAFALVIPEEFDVDQNGQIDTTEGRWVLAGGVDVSTGLPWSTRMSAAMGNYLVTPLTTVVENLVRSHGFTLEAAEARVIETFGLEGVSLAGLNPLQAIATGDEGAATAYRTHVKLHNAVLQIANLYAGASADDFTTAFVADAVYADIAARIVDDNSTLDVSQVETLADMIQSVSFAVGLSAPGQAVIDGAAETMAAANQAIDELPRTRDVAHAEAIIRVKQVAQGALSQALYQVGAGSTDIATVAAEFTGANLQAKIAAATVGTLYAPELAVSDVIVREGAAGTTILEFTVLLNGAHTFPISVDYVTEGDTAVEGSDYLGVSGTLNWAPGDTTSRTVQVVVLGDTVLEADEYFAFGLVNNNGAVLYKQSAYGYIFNDDQLVQFADDAGPNEHSLQLNLALAYFELNGEVFAEGYFTDPLTAYIHGSDVVDDKLTLDFSTNSFRSDNITFYGGVGGFDSAEILGGEFSQITHRLTNATDGRTILEPRDFVGLVTFHWFGLEPFLINVGSAEDLIFELPIGTTDAVLEDADLTDATQPGMMQLRSPSGAFETTIFTAAVNRIVIRGGAAPATIAGLDPAFTGTIEIVDANTFFFEAETDFGHLVGQADGDGWTATTAVGEAGYLGYGPYTTAISAGLYTAWFRLQSNGAASGTTPVVTIDVWEANSGRQLAKRVLRGSDFTAANVYQDFALEFESPNNAMLEFRTYWHDTADAKLDRVKIEPRAAVQFTADAGGFGHLTGQADSGDWTATTSTDSANYLAYGPYTTDFDVGLYTAVFRLKTNGAAGPFAPVVTIDVWDFATNRLLAKRVLRGEDFAAANVYQDFTLPFEVTTHNAQLEFRTFWHDTADVSFNRVRIDTRSPVQFEAETELGHLVGRSDGDGWSAATATDAAGYLAYGPYTTELETGLHSALFRLQAGAANASALVVTIDVWDATAGLLVAKRVLRGGDFTAPGVYQDFAVPFEVTNPNAQLEFRTFWHDNADAKLDRVRIENRSPVQFEGEFDFFHTTGSDAGDGWAATVAQNAEGYLTFGPYTTAFDAGLYSAAFRLLLASPAPSLTTNVARIDVYDSHAGKLLSERTLTGADFTTVGVYQEINLPFELFDDNAQLEFRTYWFDTADLKIDRVRIVQREVLRYEAELDFAHYTGASSGDGWSAAVAADDAGYLAFGPYTRDIAMGTYAANFRLKVNGAAASQAVVAVIDVWDSNSATLLARREVTRGEFDAADVYQGFGVRFEVPNDQALLEFRTFFTDVADVTLDSVRVMELNALKFEAETELTHEVGQANGDGWSAQVATAAEGFLLSGPPTTGVAAGRNSAIFRLQVSGPPTAGAVALVEARDTVTDTVLVSKTLMYDDFTAPGVYQDFELPFEVFADGRSLAFRTYFYDRADLKADNVRVLQTLDDVFAHGEW